MRMFFRFLDPGKLMDGEMELVPPRVDLVDEILISLWDQRTRQHMPREAAVERPELLKFVQCIPRGRQSARGSEGGVPAYHFWMRISGESAREQIGKSAVIAGGIALRIGSSQDVQRYYGHVGYHVYPPSRSHHYAERAVRLLLPLAQRHGLKDLWITCNPDNIASRRTCERLGAELIETVDVPAGHPLYLRGETRKCRYRMVISS